MISRTSPLPTLALVTLGSTFASADPLLNSWHTADSGKYARIWATIEDETTEKSGGAVTSQTTWDRSDYPGNNIGIAAGDQTVPVYGGVQEIHYDDNYVYVRSSGLGTHTMGPWYDDIYTRDTMFASFPGNQAILYRLPRSPDYPQTYVSSSEPSNPGACGLFANGVLLFNTTDTFGYVNATGADGGPGQAGGNGDGYWNRDAFVNEGPTFDSGNSHQAMEQHHYHASPTALRHLLGDSVDHDPSVVFTGLVSKGGTNPYSENFNGQHSPIIGWVNDGLPMYGPYGYSDPTDPTSAVRLMVTGYQERDGSNGSYDIPANGRDLLPQWVVTLGTQSSTAVPANATGPDVDAEFVLGRYMEDYAFKGDLSGFDRYEGVAIDGAFVEGTHYDLNEYNTRFCVTPEFPDGTWAYFTAIKPNGDPTYPYNLSPAYFGDPTLAGTTGTIPAGATLHFEGGAANIDKAESITADSSTEVITIVWDGVEGGVYRVDTTPDLETWDESGAEFTAGSDSVTTMDSMAAGAGGERHFYRLTRTGLAPYEDSTGTTISEGSVSFVFTFTGDLPPNEFPITGASVGGVPGVVSGYTVSGQNASATIGFDASSFTVGQSYTAILNVNGPPPQMLPLTFTSTNSYTHSE